MSKLNLLQKLVEIRKEIDSFTKDTEGYNYSYVSGSQVLSKIQNKMNELGVILYPVMKDVDHSTFDYQQYNRKTEQMEDKTDFVISGDMQYVWQNAENPEERITINWKVYGQQDDISKAFGSGLTYSERYFLLKFFNAPTDDDDPDARQGGRRKGTGGQASDKQRDFVTNLIRQKSSDQKQQREIFIKMITDLKLNNDMTQWTSQQASSAISYLKEQGEQNA